LRERIFNEQFFQIYTFMLIIYNSMRKTTWLGAFVFILFFTACTGNSKSKTDAKTNDAYEKGKLSVEEIEKKNPEKFLSVSGSDRRNILGQTVVKASIVNHAKMVDFKDIEIKLSFYSKTGALLEEDHETVYQSIHPGGSASFKSKYFAPKGTDSVGLTVTRAKY
jgi:hypothetical protein